MNRGTFRLAAATVALACALILWWMERPAQPPQTAGGTPGPGAPLPPPTPDAIPAAFAPPAPHTPPTIAALLDDALAQIKAAGDAQASREILAALRRRLDALPRDLASREVQTFLSLKRDAPTRLDVTVQAGGRLGDTSSLRVFLLDYLGQIDRPAAAAAGREILGTPTSADEWAVSLRNVAWAEDTPDTLAYLRAKAREMIANAEWRQSPSAGFLEAFDVIVHARGFDLTPQLGALVRDKENRAVAHAAYLTLDRLTLADPARALEALSARPELMEGREQTRANFFARADVRDPLQRSLLESYLIDPRRSTEELQTFAGLFPNVNQMISGNLLTLTPTPGNADMAARDRAAIATVEAWLADPRFSRLRPHLSATRARLEGLLPQAAPQP